MSNRRTFLKQAGLLAASLPLLPQALAQPAKPLAGPDKWRNLRELFPLDPQIAHFANFLVTAHPRPVQEAIDRHRADLDRNPAALMDWESQYEWQREDEVREWAARYLEVGPRQIALTGSTTEGLAMIYGGLKVGAGQEVLITEHEHYCAQKALEFRNQRQGTAVRQIRLFDDPWTVSTDQVLSTLDKAIKPNTRVLGMTWVHSGSGVKLPVGEIGELVRRHNRERSEAERILYVVDGVHGFGVENARFADFNCDYFIAGTHKWMFGPRGTGIICAASTGMQHLVPSVATFSRDEDFATIMTPGGYHAFEHRWATSEAFKLHLQLGKAEVQQRIHQLNSLLKQRLLEHRQIQLVTPRSEQFSAGFTFLRIKDRDADAVAAHLTTNKVMCDAVDRDVGPVIRLAPSLLNDEQQIDRVMSLITQQL
ncbi:MULTISPECIES: aminotransferase class V-fold PLP-dependent enzyme [Pseudomonas]|uniref:Aminotransferase class V-fold PLP-dependent enzyme n=1 Tax=Pseudomonas juntendi TaxID=2666183 RepID=A0A7W2KJA2_9PSED|nr:MULTISPECIES: aminotransferase class V-fold PLP-dependent enzyme [Pseudomonas]NOY05006.1 aminotransferase class V-fold PLP-dependent enzyme [Gammaproteobacteria bacterium]QOH70294.1 aminotransferase class V-fold PLP-dependent enzyme [Pseudomonas putida]MBA6099414.1 aminotransferase class V-fold PLP-dependent enzyme [Pseudomonas juntendi]MBA6131152.1 aminotransferase class V-fold PLP-dependent enzyme [Pseudomonas juntendi]MBA6146356.1 aminotransferase class V-fold PLP-dependent enzyme [Pseud